MKSKFILFSAAAVLILAVACEQQTGGGNGNGNGDSAFQLNTDYFDVPQDGGTISMTYQFVNRPENDGDFFITSSDWITFTGDDLATSTLSFDVEANPSHERTDTVVIRYDYSTGFLLDTAFVHQDGQNTDVFIDAKSCTGEYYTSDKSYYTWVSTNGLWVVGSEGLNINFYSSEEPVTEEFQQNGNTYRRLVTLPAGTYTYDPQATMEPGTFCQTSFYGIAAENYGYNPRYEITDGTVIITDLGNNEIQIEAEVTCNDGRSYGLFFSGSIEDYMYING